jgi:NADH:ubiquinone oxidoreductase subunit 6 (subunit J)
VIAISLQTFFIAFFGIAAVLFGIGVFRTKSMVRSALALLFSQTAIGAMFLAMETEFLGVLQIMMMATEMSIMAIFMVMFMMDPGGLGAMEMTHQKRLSIIAAIIAALTTTGIALVADWGAITATAPAAAEQTRALGHELLGRSMLIFETAGVTIRTAMIAATAGAMPSLPPKKVPS